MAKGDVLAQHVVVSRLAIDYLLHRQSADEEWITGLEIELRMGGTTHPISPARWGCSSTSSGPVGVRSEVLKMTRARAEARARGLQNA